MAYAPFSVVFGEQPSAAKWNILGTNDASFADGTGIGNATITPSKLATGAAKATVATSQTTNSLTYADLATVGPAVTVTIGANGLALVCISAGLANDTGNQSSYVSIAVSGATTVAASETDRLQYQAYIGNAGGRYSNVFLITGLTAGSNTFTAKYRVSSGIGSFLDRTIWVLPL